MSIETGSKYQGKVSGITHFGAFVELPEGKTGLVHISEVADQYVKDINEFIKVGDDVTVKVLKVGDDGKIGLSIRKAQEKGQGQGRKREPKVSFEDKMNRFLKDSEENLATLRKQSDKKGGRSRR
ncbi:S1 RNA-binding domain-containing protein [Salicibibacter kimchii]|uniref:S1 RNA-binding domain-containing protein n=1 Tax=Salicibibacter kimchii TaxID=2099786 RepID=A0A345C073_9BACI|nr:S1 RNA-binding domain-containing protein [Salicibibacter kimchii]AXF56604.1 S1 RNA-binding domain-containing protein [Salicibibacter kimchii]